MMNIQTPAARNIDPISSHLAVDEINASGQRQSHQQQVLNALTENDGSTGAELAALTGIEVHEVRKRLNDMAGIYVQRGDIRKCTVSNRQVLTWLVKK